jgi:hypothetical protein
LEVEESQETRFSLFEKVLARQHRQFCRLDDGQPRLLLELNGVNLVFFQGRIYIHKQGEGAFEPGDMSAGHASATEVCAVLRTIIGPQDLPDECVSGARIHLFSLIGNPTRMHAYYRQLNDGEPRLLLELMGYNLVLFQDRVFLYAQGEGAFVPRPAHMGHASVMEACAALLESLEHDCFPEIQAFGHVMEKRADGRYLAVSREGSQESDSLVSLLRELKKQRDARLQIYIHAGMMKTATTFLQRRVFPNIPGVHFVAWDTHFFAHEFQRIKYGCPFSFIEEMREGFERYLESFDEDKVLISDEVITSPDNRSKGVGTMVLVMKAVFPSARMLLVLREQCSFLRSFYLHSLRDGNKRSPAVFVRYSKKDKGFIEFDLDVYAHHLDVKFFEYKALVQLLRSNFPSAHVLLFEQLKHNSQEFAAGLSEWLGEPISLEGVSQARENVGLGLVGATILKLFNLVTSCWEWLWYEPRIVGFVHWVNRLDAKFHIPYDPFPPWLQAAIRQRYAASNKELGEMIGLDVERYWGKPEKAANR